MTSTAYKTSLEQAARFRLLVSPKGHQVYTRTTLKKGALCTLTKHRNVNPASYAVKLHGMVRPDDGNFAL